jgi:hypothetical protein
MAQTDLDPNSTVGGEAGTSGALAEWSGEYVTDMLGKTRALADKPYQAYGGPLTAGASGLQNQAVAGYGALDPNQSTNVNAYTFGIAPSPYEGGITAGNFSFGDVAGQGYAPGFTAGSADMSGMQAGSFTGGTAQQYMNPYLQAALNPQIAEVRRQEAITQSQDAGRAAQAGAFGGSRSFIMDAERARNTGQQIADITGQGYARAFDTAQQQFNTEENMRQRIAEVGLDQFNKEQAGLRTDEAARRGQFNTEAERLAAFDENRRSQFNEEERARRELEERRRNQFNTETDRSMRFDEYGRNQFNEEERRRIAAGESDRRYGLDSLSAISRAGADQRAIEQEGITADYLQYQQEQQYPYEQLQFMQSMLEGLPVAARETSYVQPSGFEDFGSGLASLMALLGYGQQQTATNS